MEKKIYVSVSETLREFIYDRLQKRVVNVILSTKN